MITEQNRQALIEWAKNDIAALQVRIDCAAPDDTLIPYAKDKLLISKIALASLQAEPDHYIFKHPAGELLDSLVSETSKGCDGVIAGYVVPPVQVADPVDLSALDRLAGAFLDVAVNSKGKTAEAYSSCAHLLALEVKALRESMPAVNVAELQAQALDAAAGKAGIYCRAHKVGSPAWHKWKTAVMFLVGEASALRSTDDE